MIKQEDAEKIWGKIKPIKVGMLVSVDGEEMRARPMHNIQDYFEGTLWFFTDKRSGKVFEIDQHHDVCITYADHQTETYVSLSGMASLSEDHTMIDKFWNPFAAAWFPEGKDDPSLALLKIEIHQAEYWDGPASRMVQLFKIAKANLTHSAPNMGENRKFG